MDASDTYSRRRLLRTGTGAAAGLAAAGATGTAGAQGSAYEGYLEDEGTWGGETVDATGMEQVTVRVGAQGNGGNYAFDPPAMEVEPGTTIIWEWTGEGGGHNVVSEADEFESELTGEEGFTFEYTFEEEGIHKYYCNPHKGEGMKGAVVVGDNFPTLTGNVLRTGAVWAGAAVFGTVALLGVAAYQELFGEGSLTE